VNWYPKLEGVKKGGKKIGTKKKKVGQAKKSGKQREMLKTRPKEGRQIERGRRLKRRIAPTEPI